MTPPLKHRAAVWGATFNQDESRILTWSDDGTARIWDSASAAPLSPPLDHQGLRINEALFSPDESRILTLSYEGLGSRGGVAWLWDAHSGEPLGSPLEHGSMITGARFSPDGNQILTWSDDDTVRVWDSNTNRPLTPPLKHNSSIRGARYLQGTSRILVWSSDGAARIWESASGEPLTPNLQHDRAAGPPWTNPDETQLRTYTMTGRIYNFDLGIDDAWPVDRSVLRVEVQTGTTLTRNNVVDAIQPVEWHRKRYCEYDAIRHDLGRLSDAEWAESQRRCHQAQEADAAGLEEPAARR